MVVRGMVRCGACGRTTALTQAMLEALAAGLRHQPEELSWADFTAGARHLRCTACGERRAGLFWEGPTLENAAEEFEEAEGSGEEDRIHCKRCGAPMVWRVTRRLVPTRYFLGCSRFPDCRYAEFAHPLR